VLKSRGMAHSNKIREFVLTDHGLHVLKPASGPRQKPDAGSALVEEREYGAAVS
jgi:circadian clock protein KaiC